MDVSLFIQIAYGATALLLLALVVRSVVRARSVKRRAAAVDATP